MPPSTTTVFAGVPRSEMLEAYVRVRAHALGEEFPVVLTCRVAVEAPDQKSAHHVRLAVATAGDALFAGATAGSGARIGDVYMLIDRAFERMHVQLSACSRRALAFATRAATSGPAGPPLRKTAGEAPAEPRAIRYAVDFK